MAGAILVPAISYYFKYKAGKHFPTDTKTGFAKRTSTGFVISHLHLSNNARCRTL